MRNFLIMALLGLSASANTQTITPSGSVQNGISMHYNINYASGLVFGSNVLLDSTEVDNVAIVVGDILFSSASNTTFSTSSTITMSATNAEHIYYTLNGDTPNSTPSATNIQGSSVTLSSNGTYTIKAIAYASDSSSSEVFEATYTINIPAPVVSSPPPTSTPVTPTPAPVSTPTPTPVVSTPEPVIEEPIIDNTPTEVVDDVVIEEHNIDNTPTEVVEDIVVEKPIIEEPTITIKDVATNTDTNGVTTQTISFSNRTYIEVQIYIEDFISEANADGGRTTVASLVGENGISIDSEIIINMDGTTQNSVAINGESSTIESEIIGASTALKDDGAIQTTAEVTSQDNVKTTSTVELKADGTTSNKISVTNKLDEFVETKLNSNIVGTDTKIYSDGSLSISTPIVTSIDGDNLQVEILVNNLGVAKPTIVIANKITELPEFEVGSEVSVNNSNDTVTVDVTSTLSKNITFNMESSNEE